MLNIDETVQELTLDEKIDIISDVGNLSGHSVERLNIKGLKMADGPSGIRGYCDKDEKDGGNVAFPTPSALGATWNRDVVHKVGEALGKNCLYRKVDVLLAPGVNMYRTPLCGRNFEYFSEDPVLSGEMGIAYVQGVQSMGVGTCLKHFAANNQETYRHVINAEIDERTLRELYLIAFEKIINKANPTSIMCAYNKLNGHFCSENKKLLQDILRSEWNYDGAVISDWGAVHNSAKAISAGVDYEMPRGENMAEQIRHGLKSGILTQSQLDRAVKNILKLMNRIRQLPKNNEEYNRDSLHKIAKEAAQESIVLLKNDGILPINTKKCKTIGVFGFFAEKPIACVAGGSGGVSVEQSSIESALEYIRKYAGNNVEIIYEPLYSEFEGSTGFPNRILMQECIKKCDVSIVFVGNHAYDEVEGADRESLQLPKHMVLFADEAARYCKNTVIVMQTGAPVAPFMRTGNPKAIIEMWFNGEAAGGAIADVLFGVINPSGKLSSTFMKELPDNINYPGDGKKVRYDERDLIGYRYYDMHPENVWYPFGYGLSYTTFEYRDIVLSSVKSGESKPTVTVSCKIKNIGTVSGKEVVQLYVAPKDSSVTRPIKELKDFTKIHLNVGEEKEIKFVLNDRAFAYYNTNTNNWHVESGVYEIMIAASSTDIRLRKDFEIYYDSDYSIERKLWYNYFEIPDDIVEMN